MSQYREAILTDKGLDFARKAVNGLIKITFTKGVFSADQHQSDSEQTLQGLTTLSSFLQSDPINYVSPTDEANVNVPLRFRNDSLQSDGVINTVGLYASDGTNEILYSVIVNDSPETFQAYNGKTPESVKINYETQVGRAEQVSVQVSPMGMVTEEEFQSNMATKVTFSDGYITTGNGTFVPAALGTVNSQMATKADAADVATINTNLNGFKVRQMTNNDDFYNLPIGIYLLNDVNPQHSPYGNQNCVGTAISFGGYIQYFDQNGTAFIISPYNGGWQKVANEPYVDSVATSLQSQLSTNANELSSAVTYSGAYITTGSGTFVPADSNAVNTQISTINTNLNGFKVQQMNNSMDFWNLPIGIYILSNVNPQHSPFGNQNCVGTAISFGGYVEYFDQNGSQYTISPYNGGWQKTPQQADIKNLQTQINALTSQLTVRAMTNDDDFFSTNITTGLYTLAGVGPKNNPYNGTTCYGSAIRVGTTWIYIDQGGATFVLAQYSNGWKQI